MPHVKFDFFKVETPLDASLTFEEAMDEICALPSDKRTFSVDGNLCFASEKKRLRGIAAYLCTRVRMNALPHKAKLDGTRTKLELDEDEGLGEDMALAYSPSLSCIAVQRNRHSLSLGSVEKMLNHYVPELQVHFLPILRLDALERLAQCRTLKKVRFKVAGTQDFSFLQNSDLSIYERISIQEMLSEPYADLTLSVGRKKVGLSEKVQRWITLFTGLYRSGEQDIVHAVEAVGKEDEHGHSSYIDLLQDRLIHIDDVALDGRSVDTDHLLKISCAALTKNYKELSNSHGNHETS